MRQAIQDKVKRIIIEQLNVAEEEVIPDDALFIDDLGFDSLDSIEVIMEIEDEFNIEIPDEDVEKISKVEDLIRYVEDKVDPVRKDLSNGIKESK